MAEVGSRRARQRGEDKQERRSTVRVVGLGLVLCAFLVLFFVPASFKVGYHWTFIVIVGVLAAFGVALIASGTAARS